MSKVVIYTVWHSSARACQRQETEKLTATLKRSIVEWALPLASEGKFSEIADPRLNGKYVEEELKRVVLVALVCAHNQPEKRPTMLEVLDLLKGKSKEKLSELENSELFKNPQSAVCNDEISATKEEKDPKPAKETKPATRAIDKLKMSKFVYLICFFRFLIFYS